MRKLIILIVICVLLIGCENKDLSLNKEVEAPFGIPTDIDGLDVTVTKITKEKDVLSIYMEVTSKSIMCFSGIKSNKFNLVYRTRFESIRLNNLVVNE
jgi:hypothetical protein